MEQALRAIANARRRAMLELVWGRERGTATIRHSGYGGAPPG
jgi:hypothetical protein